MAIEADALFKSRDKILTEALAAFQTLVPDLWVDEDGVIRMLLDVESGMIEGLYQANQILLEDTFIQSASQATLEIHGEQLGVERKGGTAATGSLRFSGVGGTYIPIGTEVSYDPGVGEEGVLVFDTTLDGTLPAPGSATALTAAGGAAGTVTGTLEYAVTFVTAAGETIPGAVSTPVTVSSKQVDLTNIPVGGPGTTQRKIYRRPVGGTFALLTTIANNVATTATDNTAEPLVGAEPPTVSTAEAISLPATAENAGAEYNVVTGAVTVLNDVPDGITSVSNSSAFTGGTDEEDSEIYRQRLLNWVRAPGTGAPADIKNWAEEVDGVETATVFSNDNLGTPTNGHVTVRISGPGGSIPDSTVQANVLAALQALDMANVTIHVTTFTAVATNVTVALTLLPGYLLADVSPSVDAAIRSYINNLEAGETAYIAGIIDAVFGIPGVATLTVSTPATNQTTTASQKRTPGTITIT